MPAPVQIVEARPGLPEILLSYGGARARVSLQGAHITEYAPEGQDNLLWVSESARFAQGAAIRGGIPLCWPWFGANPDLPDRPQHGYARTRPFKLAAQKADSQQTAVVLELDASSDFPEWNGAARLEVEIRLSDRLWMELRTRNLAERELPLGVGLHSYFRVSDCRNVAVPAVTGLAYLDKPAGFQRRVQTVPLVIDGEVDRVYLDPPDSVRLIDPQRPGTVRIDAWGHSDLVIWNPGPSVARSMADFDDLGYRSMVCIEPALALDNRKRLAPGETFAVGQILELESELRSVP
jgi:glucose-6-phosphate 1-epimerase